MRFLLIGFLAFHGVALPACATDPYVQSINAVLYAFTTTASIGTPPQTFTFVVDLFDYGTYVVDDSVQEGNCCPSYCSDPKFCEYTCYSRCCSRNATGTATDDCRFYFNSNLSSTYVKNGSLVDYGFAGIDTVTLADGNLRLENTLFGQTTNTYHFNRYIAQLGLGRAASLVSDVLSTDPILWRISAATNTSHVFGLWINKTASVSNGAYDEFDGEISYGSMNPAKCSSPAYSALRLSTDFLGDGTYGGYGLTLSSIEWGTYSLSLPAGLEFNATLYPRYRGASFLVGSRKIYNDMLNAVTGGNKYMDCDEIPPLVLTIGGAKYSLPQERFTTQDYDDNDCLINIGSNEQKWGLGQGFLQEYCLIVDYDDNRLGLAENIA